jgi:hypothetical protein
MPNVLTTIIIYIISHCLLDNVVYRIKLCLNASEDVLTIAKATKVSKKTIYKLQLNLNV